MGDGVDYKFGQAPGLPAVEHAKKRIQERKAAKSAEAKAKKEKYAKNLYTMIGGKVIMLTVKPGGLYRSYFDSVKKLGPDIFKAKVKKWKEAKIWVDELSIDEVVTPMMEQMQADQAKEK